MISNYGFIHISLVTSDVEYIITGLFAETIVQILSIFLWFSY